MNGKDIEKASVDYQMATRPMAIGGDAFSDMVYRMNINPSFISGAEWVLNNLWKPADGDDLPEIDREVIALIPAYDGWKVIFAHRPDPEGYWGKSVLSDEYKHFLPETYDGWNIPNIKWWLDLDLPKTDE